MKQFYQFEFNEQIIGEECYGHGKDDALADKTYIQSLLDLAKTYAGSKTGNILEWGSGITSLMFSDFLNDRDFGELLTIDHNPQYLEAVCSALTQKNNVTALAIDTIGPRESQSDICLNYSSLPLHFNKQFDFIYIDGRRRVECAFIAALISHEDTVIVVHDYRRYRYQHMLALFEVILDGPHFRVMKVRHSLKPILNQELINVGESINANGKIICKSHTGNNWIKIINSSNLFLNNGYGV